MEILGYSPLLLEHLAPFELDRSFMNQVPEERQGECLPMKPVASFARREFLPEQGSLVFRCSACGATVKQTAGQCSDCRERLVDVSRAALSLLDAALDRWDLAVRIVEKILLAEGKPGERTPIVVFLDSNRDETDLIYLVFLMLPVFSREHLSFSSMCFSDSTLDFDLNLVLTGATTYIRPDSARGKFVALENGSRGQGQAGERSEYPQFLLQCKDDHALLFDTIETLNALAGSASWSTEALTPLLKAAQHHHEAALGTEAKEVATHTFERDVCLLKAGPDLFAPTLLYDWRRFVDDGLMEHARQMLSHVLPVHDKVGKDVFHSALGSFLAKKELRDWFFHGEHPTRSLPHHCTTCKELVLKSIEEGLIPDALGSARLDVAATAVLGEAIRFSVSQDGKGAAQTQALLSHVAEGLDSLEPDTILLWSDMIISHATDVKSISNVCAYLYDNRTSLQTPNKASAIRQRGLLRLADLCGAKDVSGRILYLLMYLQGAPVSEGKLSELEAALAQKSMSGAEALRFYQALLQTFKRLCDIYGDGLEPRSLAVVTKAIAERSIGILVVMGLTKQITEALSVIGPAIRTIGPAIRIIPQDRAGKESIDSLSGLCRQLLSCVRIRRDAHTAIVGTVIEMLEFCLLANRSGVTKAVFDSVEAGVDALYKRGCHLEVAFVTHFIDSYLARRKWGARDSEPRNRLQDGLVRYHNKSLQEFCKTGQSLSMWNEQVSRMIANVPPGSGPAPRRSAGSEANDQDR